MIKTQTRQVTLAARNEHPRSILYRNPTQDLGYIFGLEGIRSGETHKSQPCSPPQIQRLSPGRAAPAPPVLSDYPRLLEQHGVVPQSIPTPQTPLLNHNGYISCLTLSQWWCRLNFAGLGFKKTASILIMVLFLPARSKFAFSKAEPSMPSASAGFAVPAYPISQSFLK